MYKKKKKRNIKFKEKIEKLNNLNKKDISIKNNVIKVNKLLNKNNKDHNISNNILRNKNNANNKNNNKIKNSNSASKIIKYKRNKFKTPNKNHSSIKSINLNKDEEETKNYDYNLDKERQILLQMIETKKLPKEFINNKLNKIEDIYSSEKIIKTENNIHIRESDKIIDEFFMRQLI